MHLAPENWKRHRFADLAKPVSEKYDPITSDKNYPCIELEHLSKEDGKLLGFIDSKQQASIKTKFKKNDVLFGKLRPYLRKFLLADFEGVCTTEIWALRINDKVCSPDFLFRIVQRHEFIQFANTTSGSKMPRADWDWVAEFAVDLPPLAEQKKIAEILSTWDKSVETTEKLIAAKQKLKKSLMQRLLTGSQRFPEFHGQEWETQNTNKAENLPASIKFSFGEVPSGWKIVSLNKIFTERNEYSANLKSFPLYSFTIEKGVTPKTDRYERSFLLKNQEENEYKLVYQNDFVINPMNLRFGAISYSKVEKTVAVSAYYDVASLKNEEVDIDFIEELLTSPKMFHIYNRVATGSLIEKQRVHYSEFKKIRILLPPVEEQKKIGEVARKFNENIRLLQKQLIELKQQKRGLMQKLLTGKTRVKTEEN